MVDTTDESHPDFAEALATSAELTAHLRGLELPRLIWKAAVIDRQHIRSSHDLVGFGDHSTEGDESVAKLFKGKGKGKTEWAQSEILGWSRFLQSLDKQHAALAQLTAQQATRPHSTDPRDSPLPPVLSNVTMAKVILSASTPITGVRVIMNSKNNLPTPGGGIDGKPEPRKKIVRKNGVARAEGEEEVVDVICRGGAEWIKLWTKKESQMLAEFREQDSYITSDWSDSDSDSPGASSSRPAEGLTNSLISSARSLLSLANSALRPPGASPPAVTIRLTRIPQNPPNGYGDPRIQETFDVLCSMGVQIQFGDLAEIPLRSLPRPVPTPGELLPSLRINLDPTALVGLCADALHHTLPRDMNEARRRYFRTRRYLHDSSPPASGTATPVQDSTVPSQPTAGAVDEAWLDGYDDHRQSQHSRELLKEAMDEVRSPLIEELRDTLARAIEARGGGELEFWTTDDALRHLKEAMGNTRVVGEGMEQQRMRRLIGLEDGDFWEGSRYEGEEGCLRGLKLRIFPDRPAPATSLSPNDDVIMANGQAKDDRRRSFHLSTAATTKLFLEEYHAVADNPSLLRTTHANIPSFLRPERLPVPKVAELTVPLPIVSLGAMQRGAEEGMTTLCMGNVVWRDMFSQARWTVRGWTQGNWELERERERGRLQRRKIKVGADSAEGSQARDVEAEDGDAEIGEGEGDAVIWLMPYRSLGEGKRVRFENGDYSFPVPK